MSRVSVVMTVLKIIGTVIEAIKTIVLSSKKNDDECSEE